MNTSIENLRENVAFATGILRKLRTLSIVTPLDQVIAEEAARRLEAASAALLEALATPCSADEIWRGGHELQIDSCATGIPQAHGYYLAASNKVNISLTDGHCSWSAEVSVPKDFRR